MSTKPTIDAVTQRYLLLRDRKAQMEKEHKERKKKIDDAMATLENWLLKEMDALGAQSVKTRHGTPYKSLKESITVADRDAWLKYLQENGDWELADIRASKSSVKQHMAESDGELPPGLNYRAIHTINVVSK